MADNNSMPGWAKGILAIVGTAAIAFIGWKTYKEVQLIIADKSNKKVGNDAASQANSLIKQGQALSYPEANYGAAANTIQQLLDGCQSSGSELKVVDEIIKVVKNATDWWHLVAVFSNRDIADCGSFGFSHTNYDLITLLKDQITSVQIAFTINENGYQDSGAFSSGLSILSKFLATKGVNI